MPGLDEVLATRRLALIVALPENSVEMARAAYENGADAIKTHINMIHRASGITFGDLEQESDHLRAILDAVQLPVGIVPGARPGLQVELLGRLAEMGFDFWDAFAHFVTPDMYYDKRMKRMVAVDSTFTDQVIHALDEMAFDAMELAIIPKEGYGGELNVADLARYRTLIRSLNTPVVIPSQRRLKESDVRHLAEAGASAVMIGVLSTGGDVRELARQTRAFRRVIDSL